MDSLLMSVLCCRLLCRHAVLFTAGRESTSTHWLYDCWFSGWLCV